MKPFEGSIMSTSGGNASDKKRLAELITQGGGVYSKDLTRSCTHLLIRAVPKEGAKMSDKEKAAREWANVRILYEAWVADAMTAAGGVAADAYVVPDTRAPRRPASAAAVPQAEGVASGLPQPAPHPPAGQEAALPRARPGSAQQQSAQERAPAQRPGSAAHSARHQPARAHTLEGSTAVHRAQGGNLVARAEALPHEIRSQETAGSGGPSLCKTATSGLPVAKAEQSDGFLSSGRSPQAPRHAPLPSTSGRDWQQPLAECEPYLDGLRVYVACAAPSEYMELVSICREGGACRYPALDPLLTHIVMGSDRLANEVAAVKQHQQRHSALVRVVDAQWLRPCSTSCSRVDEDAYVLGLAALMPSTHVHGREVGPEQGNRGSSRSAWDGEATRHGSSVSEGQSRAFLDCWFTLAALEKDPGEQKRIYNIIRKAGGRVFDSGRLSLVTNLAGAYAVCPLGFPPPARKEAMCHPDFKRVPEANHVTAYWVELSEEAGRPVRELGHKRVTCAPLPHALPLPGMARVRITTSNMDEEEKAIIKELVKQLGGCYTAKMSRTNTHLIVDRALGQKWENAEAYGVLAVRTEWLVDTAVAGRLLPEQEYMPNAPLAGEQAHAAVTQFPFEQTGRPGDAAAPAASRQDVRQGNEENNPLKALLAEGDKQRDQDAHPSSSAIRSRQRSKLQEMKASLSNQDITASKEPGAKEREHSEVWEAATRLGNFLEAVAPPVLHGSQLDVNEAFQRPGSAGGGRAGRQLSNLGQATAGEAASGHSCDSAVRSPTHKRTRTGSVSGTNSAGSSGRKSERPAAQGEGDSAAQLQCSQQVGYGKRPGPGVSTRRRATDNARSNLASDSNAAKQRLKQAMTSSTRRDGASGDDALKLVLGFAE